MKYLRKHLESTHPNLYLYTSKNELDKVFDSLSNSITEPKTELDFYKHISVISSLIKDGHTIILPCKSTMDYHIKTSKFLPYKLTISNKKLFVDMVCTKESAILEGSEILSINSLKASEIIETLMNRQVKDGNNLTYPIWILNNYFKAYYSYIFGHPDTFTIEYKNDEIIKTIAVSALPNDSINYYRKLKYPLCANEKRQKEGITFKFASDHTYAILKIKDFHKEVLKQQYHQDFKDVIYKFFQELNSKQTSNLILDLRDNQGGDIKYGAFLLSYLLDKPFTIVESYFKVDRSGAAFQLKRTKGEAMGLQNPTEKVFKGTVYVLINGGSFSNSGIVAACLKRYNRATFAGEETGGNNKNLAGDIKEYNLPNTRIQIQLPTTRYLLDETMPLTGHGTMPDIAIQHTLTNGKVDEDSTIQFIIDTIANNK